MVLKVPFIYIYIYTCVLTNKNHEQSWSFTKMLNNFFTSLQSFFLLLLSSNLGYHIIV